MLLPDLVAGPELPEDTYALQEGSLLRAIIESNEPILHILVPLGPYLTTENDATRSRAVSLLAKVCVTTQQWGTARVTKLGSARLLGEGGVWRTAWFTSHHECIGIFLFISCH